MHITQLDSFDAHQTLKVGATDYRIFHQVNLEFLLRPVWSDMIDGQRYAFPDSLVACDSHTPMINALGVMGWGSRSRW